MARIDTLLDEIQTDDLRDALRAEVRELRKRVPFGLVFERHLPEFAVVPGDPIATGSFVTHRRDNGRRLRVVELDGDQAQVVENGSAEPETIAFEDLVAVRGLNEQIFPGLSSIERVERAPAKPSHAVIKGENFHALQLLDYIYNGQVDCIYIDPPYNTGATNWTYNNRFVDDNDSWRHSKWLSFMEKRLKIAKRLLKPDGVLIVTVDEHEVHHLGVLLEQVLPEAIRQLVTIVNNPKGVTEARFSRAEEYAYCCFLGTARVAGIGDDLLTPLAEEETDGGRPRWKGLLRSGSDASREDRKDMFYPVLIDVDRSAVLGAGDPLPLEEAPVFDEEIDGCTAVWPVRRDGSLGRWAVGHTTLRTLIDRGYVALGSRDDKRRTWGLTYLSQRHRDQIDSGVLKVVASNADQNVVDVRYIDPAVRRVKRVWHRSSHDSGAYGSDLLGAFLGARRAFAFPKSLYATRDALASVTADRPDALILDFFAGSGTTLHATALLNAQDGGNRRCVLVTNNELDGETTKKLHKQGLARGDEEFEAAGVFEAVTRPRCKAALTGVRPDGEPVKGKYLDGRPYAEGFAENVEFFELEYLDRDGAELGWCLDRQFPLYWLQASAVGPLHGSPEERYSVEAHSPYAVFNKHGAMRDLRAAIAEHGDIRHVFCIEDSPEAFIELGELLGAPGRELHQVPLDYMNFFRRYRAG